MSKNLVETILGAVVLLIAGLFLSYSTQIRAGSHSGGENYRLYADFSEVGGLKKGADVRISGVKIGSVEDLQLEDESYLARATLSINGNVKLPDDTASRVSSESLLGGAFLALDPGGSEEMLEEGDRILYNQDAQNLEQLLGQFIFSLQDAEKTEENE